MNSCFYSSETSESSAASAPPPAPPLLSSFSLSLTISTISLSGVLGRDFLAGDFLAGDFFLNMFELIRSGPVGLAGGVAFDGLFLKLGRIFGGAGGFRLVAKKKEKFQHLYYDICYTTHKKNFLFIQITFFK